MDLELDFNLQRRLEQEAERQGLSSAECIQQLLADHLPPLCDWSIADFERDGVRFQLTRLSDQQYTALRSSCIPIEEDTLFQLRLMYVNEGDRSQPQLGELYTALRLLFGPSGVLFDDYKGSFSFPFQLCLTREGKRYRYLFKVDDWKGSLEFHLSKIVDRPEELGEGWERYAYRKPMPEFGRDEIRYYLAHFYGFLKGYIQSGVRTTRHEPFVNSVRASLGVYGYLSGQFFANWFDSHEEYEETLQALSERLRAERCSA